MHRILMVCLGNICRSPMAEGILRHKAAQAGIDLHIDSAATSNYHSGDAPDIRAVDCLKKFSIDISQLRARQIRKEDFEQFDHILVMDQNNHRDVLELAENSFHKQKVRLMLSYLNPNEPMGVPDPYFGGNEGFDRVYEMLDQACDILIRDLKR